MQKLTSNYLYNMKDPFCCLHWLIVGLVIIGSIIGYVVFTKDWVKAIGTIFTIIAALSSLFTLILALTVRCEWKHSKRKIDIDSELNNLAESVSTLLYTMLTTLKITTSNTDKELKSYVEQRTNRAIDRYEKVMGKTKMISILVNPESALHSELKRIEDLISDAFNLFSKQLSEYDENDKLLINEFGKILKQIVASQQANR